ncbi:MAG TPA: TIGR03792 family protein [Coleofasciculaceae cyanobacterium]
MVIEWLKARVDPDKREQYVQKDAEIWTRGLSKYPGFLGKEVWISPEDLSEVVMVIHWESFEKWHSIPAADLEKLEKEFSQAMGNTYELVDSAGYQVRNITRA